MMLKLKSLPLLIILPILFFSCEKEYSVEGNGPGGTAVFSFVGSSGACVNSVVTGTYKTGTALINTNIVTVTVDVSASGTYVIATPVVNGISFSGSGIFAAPGIQAVQLTGTGTPAAEGTFDFTPGANACTFSVTVAAAAGSTDFINCTIDGVARTFNEGVSGATADPTNFSLSGNETTAGNSASFQIDLTKSPAITPGNYDQFSPANLSTYCVGIFSDGTAATSWTVAFAGQSGSFSVNVATYANNRMTGTFSGTLYSNDGMGAGTITITAGQFSVPF